MSASQKSETTKFFQPVADNLHLALGLPTCIWLTDEKKKSLRIVASAGLSSDRALVERYVRRGKLDLARPFGASSVFATGKPVEIPDISADKNWRYKNDTLKMGLRSAISVPLRRRNMIVGVLDVYTREPRHFTLVEKKLIEGFASQASRTEQYLRGLTLLDDVNLLIASELEDVKSLFEQVMRATQQVLECEHVTLFHLDERGDLARVATSAKTGIKRAKFKLGEGIAGWVAKTGRSQIIRDATKHPHFVRGLSSGIQQRSMLVVPMLSAKGAIGVISADRDGLNGFDQDDRTLLEALARHTVVALENAELFQHRDLVANIAREITAEQDQNKLLQMILDKSLDLLHCRVGSIALQNEETGNLEYKYVLGKTLETGTTIRKGLMVAAFKTGKPVCVDDVRKDRRYVRRVSATRSELDVPLLIGERPIGVLNVESPRLAAFDDAHIRAAVALAAQAAVALTNAKLYTQTRRQLDERVNDLNQLRALDEAITQESLDRVLQKIVQLAVQLTPAQYGNLWLIDPQSKELRFGHESSKLKTASKHPDWRVIDEHSINGHVALTRKAYRSKDVRADSHYHGINRGVRSELCVPLLRGDKAIGTLNVESTALNAFDQDHERLLGALAGQAAIAIDNARIYERLDTLVTISRAVTSTLELDQVLARVLDESMKALGATYGTIRLANWSLGEKGELVLKAHKGKIGKRTSENIPVGQGITGWVADQEKSLLVGDVRNDPRYLEFFSDTHCEMAVPIKVGLRTIGVLNVEHPKSFAFDDNDLRLLEAIAIQAGGAIRNANLYKSTRVANEMGVALTAGTRLPENQVLELIRTQAAQVMNMDNMYIALYDEATDMIRFPIAFEEGKPSEIESRKFGKGRTEEIIRTKKPIFCATKVDAKKWYNQPGRQDYKKDPKMLSSWLGVPMLLSDKVLGVIATYHPQEHVYSIDDLDVLQAIANEAVVALDNAHLYYEVNKQLEESNQHLEKTNQRLKILVDVVRELSSGILLNEKEILERIYGAAQQLTGARDMFVALYNDATNEITFPFVTKAGKPDQVASRFADMKKRGKTEEVILTREPVLHHTYEEAVKWYKEPEHAEFTGKIAKSHLAVPMIARDKVLGVLAVWDWKREYAYDQTDQALIASMANHAAIAIENARLYAKQTTLAEENARLYKEARGEAVAAKKLATLGTVMGALQHRINNRVALIPSNVIRLRNHIKQTDPDIDEALTIIERNARYTTEIIERIQKNLRETAVQDIDINNVLGEIVATTKEQLAADATRPSIEIICNLDDSIFPIQGPVGQVAEAFDNLVENACRAMAHGGQLTITSQRVDNEFQVRVADTGGGIPPAMLERLFKQPVSSKEYGGSSGLGLWLSQLMLQQISGEITVERTGSDGTTMLVKIPASSSRS